MHFFIRFAFMQALGWATLNSFWQIGLLWCLYLAAAILIKLTPQKKYIFALTGVMSGFAWFVLTLCFYQWHPFQDGNFLSMSFFNYGFVDKVINAASSVYLIMLCLPLFNLYKNWYHLQVIKTKHLSKADYTCRLFIKKIALQLGIKRPVHVYISKLVKSPVTVGYLKPIILLPVASFNNLSMQQAEAILLHELSHIKRGDYLINLAVTIVHTLLYFNPFIRLFVKIIEAERETCCDQTVLQFEYDKISYASALLILERHSQSLLIAATGKNNLLQRIQQIIGIEAKPAFTLRQVISLFSALLFIIGINAFLFSGEKYSGPGVEVSYNLSNPFYFFEAAPTAENKTVTHAPGSKKPLMAANKSLLILKQPKAAKENKSEPLLDEVLHNEPSIPDKFINVKFMAEAQLNAAQKEQVKATIKSTKDILSKLEWKELEKTMADGLTRNEKEAARKQYLSEVQKLNWQKLENNLTQNYSSIDWDKLTTRITGASALIKLDSLQTAYSNIVVQVSKSVADSISTRELAIPDVSKESLLQIQSEAQKRLNIIKAVRNRKVIRL